MIKLYNKIIIWLNSFILLETDAAEPWSLGFQDSATLVHEKIINLHDNIMFYLVIIIIMVLCIIIEIVRTHINVKFVHKYLTHGTILEIVWTITPAIILMAIAWPSFELLYFMDEVIDPLITLKVIGHQWYWTYEYSDYSLKQEEKITFDSYMVATDELKLGDLRLLEVSNTIVLPINTNIRVIVTAADVLHSWAIPSLGIKIDCVPGRLNQTSMIIKRAGNYYGQCSEICGVQHGFMPITIEGVEINNYNVFISSNLKNDSSMGTKMGASELLNRAWNEFNRDNKDFKSCNSCNNQIIIEGFSRNLCEHMALYEVWILGYEVSDLRSETFKSIQRMRMDHRIGEITDISLLTEDLFTKILKKTLDSNKSNDLYKILELLKIEFFTLSSNELILYIYKMFHHNICDIYKKNINIDFKLIEKELKEKEIKIPNKEKRMEMYKEKLKSVKKNTEEVKKQYAFK